MIVYLIRHGETVWNKKGIIQGHKDSPLTAKGLRSSQKLGKRLAKEGIRIIYSSDLGRCVQTAEIINQQVGVRLVKTAKLREQNFGDYNGKPNKWLRKKIDIFNPDSKAPGGESFNQMKTRILGVVYSLANKNFEKILIITHEGPLRAIFSEYYQTDANSKKCNSSSDRIYKIELRKNRLKNLSVLT